MIPKGAYAHSIESFFTPVGELIDDPMVSEIMINGPYEIWIEKRGKIYLSNCAFSSEHALRAALTNVAQFAGRHFGADFPILEAHLPDGSRIEAVLPPLAENGPIVAIRRFSKSTLTVEKLIEFGSITKEAAEYLKKAVAAKKNVVVSGGTGSGKTSLLGALSSFIRDSERIVVIDLVCQLRDQNVSDVLFRVRIHG